MYKRMGETERSFQQAGTDASALGKHLGPTAVNMVLISRTRERVLLYWASAKRS
jgi:hypothetical protein